MKTDYTIDLSDEITEEELEGMQEETKELVRFFIEHNPEKKVIEIYPANGNHISLHGVGDVNNFIKAIQDYSREVYEL